MKVLSHPDKFLWSSSTKEFPQIKTIFNHIKGLQYEDRPDYQFIRNELKSILHVRKLREQNTATETVVSH
jgi:hypothetical protein